MLHPARLVRDGRVRGSLTPRAAWLLATLAAGAYTVRSGPSALAIVAALAGLAAAVRVGAFGVLLGLGLLVELNGIPGIDLNPADIAISHVQDMTAVSILAACLVVVLSGRVARRSPLQRSLYGASAALAAWWLLTWFRTGLFDGVPPTLAGKYARDFLYFALLLPLVVDVLVTYPRLVRQLLWTLGVGAAIFAGAQIAQSQAHVSVNFILHSHLFTVANGTSRVYSPMTMLVRAGFALSLGALIVGQTPRIRRRAAFPALLFGASMLLQLTRAAYLGLAVGFVVAGCIWWFRRDRAVRSRARAQLIVVPVCVAILLGVGAAASAHERHVLSTIGSRAVAGYSEVSDTSGTVATRVDDTNAMLAVLGNKWFQGLGFLHPSARPFPSLPRGAIRNGDLGVLNAVMLMGVVGAVLVYLPVLLVLRALTRPPAERTSMPETEWLRLGATIWIIGVIASSITLQELFSFGGLQLSALMLAAAATAALSGARPAEQEQAHAPGRAHTTR